MTTRPVLAALALALAAPARPLDLGQEVAVSVAAARGRVATSAAWLATVEPLPGRLRLGAGARALGFAGLDPISFSTGDPDRIARGETTSLVVPDARVLSVNLVVEAVVRLAGPLEAGANLDLAGFSFGPARTGDHVSTDPAFAGPREARVSSPDLFLVGDRDRGQLDSEFFLGWRFAGGLTLRAGLTHVATEYRTVEPVDRGNRRFRRFTTQPFVGVRWPLR
jgi:hypothetical protein